MRLTEDRVWQQWLQATCFSAVYFPNSLGVQLGRADSLNLRIRVGRLLPVPVALTSRSLWTGSLWPHDREEAVSRLHTAGSQHAWLSGWCWLQGLAPGISLSLAAIVLAPPCHPSQDQSLTGSGATQPSAQCFLGTLVGKGLQSPYQSSWQQGA